ncbi:MAG: M20/M25/M40 family metallo-hydrolase [Chloroflexi bacterium]|nr:M20/M25/M40 family metallo-hydrolase [Chloroflexota bacterium]
MLQVNNISVYYGKIHALKGVSLTVHDGELVALIGSNGAGKSTTLRTISGLLRPKQGDISYHGQRIDTLPPMPRTPTTARLEQMAVQIARELGFETRGAKTGGAADGSFAADEGVPVLDGLGPVGGLDHSPDEYILKSSIVLRTALLARLMMALSG